MGADTPAEGGEAKKPEIKVEGKPHFNNGQRGNKQPRRDVEPKKEKFLGADPNLQGSVFESKRTRAEQVANFERVDELIKAQVGMECNPYVLKSLETETKTVPDAPEAVQADDMGP